MESVLRFWLDRGVDGFRIDVAHGLVKADGLPDATSSCHEAERTDDMPMFDQPGVHEIYRRWRQITDSYGVEGEDADRILCAEAWVLPIDQLAKYVRGDELHQSLQLRLPDGAVDRQGAAGRDRRLAGRGGAVRRSADMGPVQPRRGPARLAAGLRATAGDAPDARRSARTTRSRTPSCGLRRARAATTVMLALPGSAYLYQGEELGLPGGDPASRRAAPGPHLGALRPHQPRPGRLPGADPLGGRRSVVRLRTLGAVLAAPAGGLRRARSRPAGGSRGLDAGAVPDDPQAAARARPGSR